jgi:RNA polymerase sigma-70 factor (ECF subfamily)
MDMITEAEAAKSASEAAGDDGRTKAFREGLIREMRDLRAFAVSLCGSFHQADDLLQETLLKAWSNSSSFIPGTNLRAWLVTILRNTYYSQYRKRGREVADTDGFYSSRLASPPNQESSLDMSDFQAALQKLAPEHRDVLLMVGASGLSYEEAAEICGVAVGTIKSRLNRARARLADLLGIKEASDLGMGSVSEAVVRAQSLG